MQEVIECYVVMTKREDEDGFVCWRGTVEKYGESEGGKTYMYDAIPLFRMDSKSPTLVLDEIRRFLKENEEVKVNSMLRNGNPKWTGYYSCPIDSYFEDK